MIRFASTNEYVCVRTPVLGKYQLEEKIIQQVGLETDSNSNDFQQRNITTRLLHFIHFSKQKNRFFVTLSDFFPFNLTMSPSTSQQPPVIKSSKLNKLKNQILYFFPHTSRLSVSLKIQCCEEIMYRAQNCSHSQR